MDADEIDRRFASAALAAARTVAPEPEDRSFLEKRLAAALGRALEMEFAPLEVRLNRKLPGVVLWGWDPQPGAFDVAVLHADRSPFALAEVKLDDIDQTLWDIFKLACGLRLDSVRSAYIVAAAPARFWLRSMEVIDIYRTSGVQARSTRSLLADYRKAWTSLMRGGRGRPVALPATLSIAPLLTTPVANYPPYELRALRIAATDSTLDLRAGWPLPESRPNAQLG